ncbi:hypothetical protein [Pantoea dispersa]|nr:hypothetical protein [Pantoea dispersa]
MTARFQGGILSLIHLSTVKVYGADSGPTLPAGSVTLAVRL